jgi:hypothetical protein
LAVISTRKTKRIHISRSRGTTNVGDRAFSLDDLNPSVKKFNEFWDFMRAIKVHGYTRAAMSVIGRSTIGAWWSLRTHEIFENVATDRQRKRLYQFYMNTDHKDWTNIKDYMTMAYKLMIGAMYLKYFGFAAYQVLRNENDVPVGFDFLHGLVVPNVDDEGNFKNPNFVQYLSSNPKDRAEFEARDIIYIMNPDWEGSPFGASDIEALAENTLPLDLYLQISARSYMENRDRPEVIYSLPADVSDEAFDDFVSEIETRWRGPGNVGRNPIAVQGELKVLELDGLPSDLPYQESRKDTREEVLATAGVAGAKLGLTEAMSSANLREVRREFHETSMIPLFKMIELAFYEQIHVREFRIKGWEFKFNNPDFLNAVERATVHMRYIQNGVYTPNDARHDLGKPNRTDSLGDAYRDHTSMSIKDNPQGSPPEGRPTNPDDPAQVGEPNDTDVDPERGDQHDDTTRDIGGILHDLKIWRRVVQKRLRKGRTLRPFESNLIPNGLNYIIQQHLNGVSNVEQALGVFDEVIEEVSNYGE